MISFSKRHLKFSSSPEWRIADDGAEATLNEDLREFNRPMERASGLCFPNRQIIGKHHYCSLLLLRRSKGISRWIEKRIALHCGSVQFLKRLLGRLPARQHSSDEVVGIFFQPEDSRLCLFEMMHLDANIAYVAYSRLAQFKALLLRTLNSVTNLRTHQVAKVTRHRLHAELDKLLDVRHAEKRIARLEVMVEESERTPLGDRDKPERELGQFHCERVDIDAVKTLFGHKATRLHEAVFLNLAHRLVRREINNSPLRVNGSEVRVGVGSGKCRIALIILTPHSHLSLTPHSHFL